MGDEGNARIAANCALALLASSGDENELDRLLDNLPGPRPFSNNRRLWERLSQPSNLLHLLDKVLATTELPDSPEETSSFPAEPFVPGVSVLRVQMEGGGIRLHDSGARSRLNLQKSDLRVRVAQTTHWPGWAEIEKTWPLHPYPRQAVWAVACALPRDSAGERGPDIIVLPELALPHGVEHLLEGTVRRYGYGVLAGRFWREVSVGSHQRDDKVHRFANEAVLVLPHDGRRTRVHVVRKPIPAAVEFGLERALSRSPTVGKAEWRIMRGHTWFLFDHPKWGGFTVGICSDLLDPLPYARMREELLHIFFASYNTDVALYRSMSWTRAWENYVNVVVANHGEMGGSFAWTPRSGPGKKLLGFEGAGIRCTADVGLPVSELAFQKENGWSERIAELGERLFSAESRPEGGRKYKTPPEWTREGNE